MHLPPTFDEFIKPARCMAKDCIAPATHILVIKTWAKGYPKTSTPLESMVTCKVCPNHFNHIDPNDFWTEDAMTQITDALRSLGRTDPDFKSSEFFWQPLKGDGPLMRIEP